MSWKYWKEAEVTDKGLEILESLVGLTGTSRVNDFTQRELLIVRSSEKNAF